MTPEQIKNELNKMLTKMNDWLNEHPSDRAANYDLFKKIALSIYLFSGQNHLLRHRLYTSKPNFSLLKSIELSEDSAKQLKELKTKINLYLLTIDHERLTPLADSIEQTLEPLEFDATSPFDTLPIEIMPQIIANLSPAEFSFFSATSSSIQYSKNQLNKDFDTLLYKKFHLTPEQAKQYFQPKETYNQFVDRLEQSTCVLRFREADDPIALFSTDPNRLLSGKVFASKQDALLSNETVIGAPVILEVKLPQEVLESLMQDKKSIIIAHNIFNIDGQPVVFQLAERRFNVVSPELNMS